MPAITLANHILRQNPQVCHALSGYNGIVVAVTGSTFKLTGRIGGHGLLESTERAPDAVLTLHTDALPKILQGRMPDLHDISLQGDAELGINLMMQLTRLQYRVQDDLKQIFSHDSVDGFARKTARVAQLLQGIAQTLMFQAAQPTPQNDGQQQVEIWEALNHCMDEIEYLHRKIDSVALSIDRLAARLSCYDDADYND